MAEKEKKQPEILVVSELPQQSIRNITDEKGDEFELITNQEALTEILKILRKLEKSLG